MSERHGVIPMFFFLFVVPAPSIAQSTGHAASCSQTDARSLLSAFIAQN